MQLLTTNKTFHCEKFTKPSQILNEAPFEVGRERNKIKIHCLKKISSNPEMQEQKKNRDNEEEKLVQILPRNVRA